MDDVIDDLVRTANRCARAAKRFEEPTIKSLCERISAAVDSVGEAWSGSWLG